MSQFAAKVNFYTSELEKMGYRVNPELIHRCTKICGHSIYNADAETVSSSDKDELARVRKNFLFGKLGLKKTDNPDSLIRHAIDKFGSKNRNKYRPMFYYIICDELGKTP